MDGLAIPRRRFPGSYFLVSGVGHPPRLPHGPAHGCVSFPQAWILVFLAVFCLFFNTGPSNTILANVTHPSMRATAFAVNILVIHALGDAASPPLLGKIVGPVGGVYRSLERGVHDRRWRDGRGGDPLAPGRPYLAADTAAVPHRIERPPRRREVTWQRRPAAGFHVWPSSG